VDECKPLPPSGEKVSAATATPSSRNSSGRLGMELAPRAATAQSQGLTLVHVRAQLEQLQPTFMS
jgi:hypothetical protein